MNRNQLLIAIATIVVVGIAVGLLLSGGGQTGPLSGTLGPVPTSMNLSVTDCWQQTVNGEMGWAVKGNLVASSGAPAANRIVTLYTEACKNGGCTVATETLVTRADGSFGIWKPHTADMFEKTQEYSASFAGDSQFGPSDSNSVRRPC